MPKLGEYRFLLNTVVFIYRTREQAAEGRKAGGTGFFVAVPSAKAPDKFHHVYVVTNVHIARGEARTLRVNTRDGGVDLLTVHDWVSLAGGPDVTVAPIALDPNRHAVEAFRSDSWLLTQEEFLHHEIDAGDDVLMVGRFVDYDGVQSNQPSLRFGHISMKEAKIRQNATGYTGPSFVIDMHSRSGYSGSPVFVYRTHGSIFAKEGSIMFGGHLMKLLGIHWGQFPERWELSSHPSSAEDADSGEAELIVDGQYVKGLSGMTCVVPAWDIVKTLEDPRLVDLRARVEATLSA
jgi:hypothetical protein